MSRHHEHGGTSHIPIIKRGVGEHIYLMFAGRSKRISGGELSSKPQGVQKIVPLILLFLTAFMMGIVLWRHVFAMH